MATYPVTAKFSPDGTAFAYIDYSNKIPDSAFANEDVTWSECMGQTDSARVSYGNEGGVVKIYDLRTKLEREVYRQNSLHADNFCMLESRRLFGLSWISNDEIAVSDIEKVVSINIHNQTLQLLYTFDDFVKITADGYAGVGPGDVFRSNINAVVSPYIYFNDLSVGVIGTDRSVSYVPNSVNSVQVIQY